MTHNLDGKIQTVLGTIQADSLGMTLVHEHLLEDLTLYFTVPAMANERSLAFDSVKMENRGWIKMHPINNRDNLLLTDESLATREARLFKLAGGATIVEVTTAMLGRDPEGLMRIARAAGINIVMGTGYYIAAKHPPDLAAMSEEQITAEIVKDIQVGVGPSNIKAGIIGEIGCSAPLDINERKVLLCCAAAQRQTGAAIYLHPGPGDESILEIIRVLSDSGANLKRVVAGHADISGFSIDTCCKLAEMGCYIAYDNFGSEGFFQLPHQSRFVEISDPQRVNDIISLIKAGFLNKILISQDIALKFRLASFGGQGYAHILNNILPIMRAKGLSIEQIETLLVENPKNLLSFSK